MPGRRRASMVFPAPGRTYHQQMMTTGGGYLQRSFGLLVAYDLGQVGLVCANLVRSPSCACAASASPALVRAREISDR